MTIVIDEIDEIMRHTGKSPPPFNKSNDDDNSGNSDWLIKFDWFNGKAWQPVAVPVRTSIELRVIDRENMITQIRHNVKDLVFNHKATVYTTLDGITAAQIELRDNYLGLLPIQSLHFMSFESSGIVRRAAFSNHHAMRRQLQVVARACQNLRPFDALSDLKKLRETAAGLGEVELKRVNAIAANMAAEDLREQFRDAALQHIAADLAKNSGRKFIGHLNEKISERLERKIRFKIYGNLMPVVCAALSARAISEIENTTPATDARAILRRHLSL
jgi:hypothetical protein